MLMALTLFGLYHGIWLQDLLFFLSFSHARQIINTQKEKKALPKKASTQNMNRIAGGDDSLPFARTQARTHAQHQRSVYSRYTDNITYRMNMIVCDAAAAVAAAVATVFSIWNRATRVFLKISACLRPIMAWIFI